MRFAFPPPSTPPYVRVAGSTDNPLFFPVHRIYCVGRNYADHTREMGGDPDREQPFFFTKPADAVVETNRQIPYPMATNNLHHEVELVVALKSGGTSLSVEQAMDHVFGYAVGLDLTRRDLQNYAKEHRQPWDTSKAFDHSAPIGSITPLEGTDSSSSSSSLTSSSILSKAAHISLQVNGQTRQSGTIDQMIWSIPEIISILSHQFVLAPGDLIFTGTPAGVGPLVPGDQVKGRIDGLEDIDITIGAST